MTTQPNEAPGELKPKSKRVDRAYRDIPRLTQCYLDLLKGMPPTRVRIEAAKAMALRDWLSGWLSEFTPYIDSGNLDGLQKKHAEMRKSQSLKGGKPRNEETNDIVSALACSREYREESHMALWERFKGELHEVTRCAPKETLINHTFKIDYEDTKGTKRHMTFATFSRKVGTFRKVKTCM